MCVQLLCVQLLCVPVVCAPAVCACCVCVQLLCVQLLSMRIWRCSQSHHSLGLELGCHEQPRPQPEAKNRTTSSNATLAWGAPSKLQMVRIKGDYLMALPLYIGWTSGTTIIYSVSPSLLKDAQTWGALQSILVHLLRRQTFLKLVPQELPPRFKALQQCRMKALAPWRSWRKGGSRCRRSRLPRRS